MGEHVADGLPRLYTFEQAIETFFPDTGLVPSDLRAAYYKKKLEITKIGHRKFVTADQIRAFIDRSQEGGSGQSKSTRTGDAGMSSGTEAGRSAQAALLAEIERMKGMNPKKQAQGKPKGRRVVPFKAKA